MNALFTILTVLIIIAAILLICVVLLQNGKGEGLASNFVAGNQTFGVRQTADLLEKVSWGLVAFIFVLSIISSFTTGSSTKAGSNDVSGEVLDRSSAPEASEAQFPTDQPSSEAPQENPATE